MLTPEDLELTKKYMNEYGQYCANRECGDTCIVYVEHNKNKNISCFKTYCLLRESGKIPDLHK